MKRCPGCGKKMLYGGTCKLCKTSQHTISMLGDTGYSEILFLRQSNILCFKRDNRYFKYDGALIYEVANGETEEQHGMFTYAERNDIHNLYLLKRGY